MQNGPEYMLRMAKQKLVDAGDQFEKDFWSIFVKDNFPNYETFWQKYTLPLREDRGINFKNEPAPEVGKIEQNIHIAQLNYGVLRHLIRCFQILKLIKTTYHFGQYDLFVEGISRLVGALDNSDEILARLKWSNEYNEKSVEKIEYEAREARKRWRNEIGDPLQKIRNYRNRIIHGSPLSVIYMDDTNKSICLPQVGKENLYMDFRLVTSNLSESTKKDFFPVQRILEELWGETIKYVDDKWKEFAVKEQN